jgi:hypothetical protein
MKLQILTIAMCLFLSTMYGQVTTGFNFGISSDYVGWDDNQGFPLTIKHEALQPINFHTNTTAGSLSNLRMFIEPNGNIGVGNFTPANTLFHIHQSNDGPVTFQMTDNITGQSVTDGFEIEFDHANNSELLFSHNEQTPFDIFTAGTDGNMFRRMRIFMTDTIAGIRWQKTRVAITTTGLGWENGPTLHQEQQTDWF